MKSIDNFCVWKVSVLKNKIGDKSTAFHNMNRRNVECFFCNGYINRYKGSNMACPEYVPLSITEYDSGIKSLVEKYLKGEIK